MDQESKASEFPLFTMSHSDLNQVYAFLIHNLKKQILAVKYIKNLTYSPYVLSEREKGKKSPAVKTLKQSLTTLKE